MAEFDNNNSNRRSAPSATLGTGLGCSPQALLATVILLVLAVLAVYLLTKEPSSAEMARSRLQIERAEALQPWNVAMGVAWRVVAIGAGLALLLGLMAGIRVVVRWLDTRSRLIRPDPQTGQFPAVKVQGGEAVVDLNRLPDGKVMTGVVGGKVGLLLVLVFRYVLGRDVPEITEQPAILVTPADTSVAQLQVTSQAQAVQALAAASRGTTAQQATQAAQSMLALRRVNRGLPPLLVEESQPREMQLLLETSRRQWHQTDGDGVVDSSGDILT
jgi:hypothetical protein